MKSGYWFILITALAFSTMEITGKMVAGQFHPFQLTFLRFLGGALFLLPFALRELRRRKLRLTWKDIAFFTLTGCTGIVLSMSFFQLAVAKTQAATVAVIFSTNAVFTVPLAILLLGEKPGKTTWPSLLLAFAGLVLIVNPTRLSPDTTGMLLAFAAAVCFSLFGVIGKTRIHRYGGLVLNAFSFLCGNAVLLALMLFQGLPVVHGIALHNLPHLIYLGLVVTGIGYLSYFEAMKRTSAITASMVFFIKPALAPVLSLLILGEHMTLPAIAGIALITGAAVLSALPGLLESRKPAPAESESAA